MQEGVKPSVIRLLGVAFIAYAVAFNVPYLWLAANFDYPGILRSEPGAILATFAAGGAALILAWLAFAAAALLFAPVAVAMAVVTRRDRHAASAIAAMGVAAAVTQAIGLSRWVYAVPVLAERWTGVGDPAVRTTIEATFTALHQFAGVGVGEAIGQSLTAFWLIGVSIGQSYHRRFGVAVATLAFVTAIVLLLGLVEGIGTVMPFDPGVFGWAAPAGYMLLTVWLIWTGVLCLRATPAE